MTKEERMAENMSRPVKIEAQYNGLEDGHTYSLNLIKKDKPNCAGEVIS